MRDFDGNGKQDLVVVNLMSNDFSFLASNGDGTFRAAANHPMGIFPFSVVAADFDRDGKADLALAMSADNLIAVIPGNGDGSFADEIDFPVGPEPHFVVSSDFNRDGKIDLAVANSASAPWRRQTIGYSSWNTPSAPYSSKPLLASRSRSYRLVSGNGGNQDSRRTIQLS